MKLFTRRKDGGGESTVTGYWLIELKGWFSICLLRFEGLSRDAFHTHAFNCFSWVLKGCLLELFRDGRPARLHPASWRPFVTRRSTFHKVHSLEPTSWVLSFRGPWRDQWEEFHPTTGATVGLTHGRKETYRNV